MTHMEESTKTLEDFKAQISKLQAQESTEIEEENATIKTGTKRKQVMGHKSNIA